MSRTDRPPGKLTVSEAKGIQLALRDKVVQDDRFSGPRYVAGVDVGFKDRRTARGAVVVLEFPSLTLRDQAFASAPVTFPYVPGYLSFREVPVVLKALAKLQLKPDIILCDGQGLAHPRRFGFACHLGVIANVPSIGVAKTRLIGDYREPGCQKGAWMPLKHNNADIGAVLRTRTDKRPLFVSVGHRISLAAAIKIVLACCTKYRLPETTRAAHRLASD